MDEEYAEGVGGGVSQVATTVFNAAWEAGIKIAERHPHALTINRYPDRRDATVNYPTSAMKLVNDTPEWIVIKATVRRERHRRSPPRRRARAEGQERRRRAEGDRPA